MAVAAITLLRAPRLRPLARRVSRRKPRKSLHERFGSLNPSKTADVVQRTRARYHLNAVAERRCTYFFSSVSPRVSPLAPATTRSPNPRRAQKGPRSSPPPRCCGFFFVSSPGLFNLANFIRTWERVCFAYAIAAELNAPE